MAKATVLRIVRSKESLHFEPSPYVQLAKGGHQIYSGPLGRHAQDLIAYFQSIPGVPVLPPHANPATWMLDITQTGAPSEEAWSDSPDQPWLAGVFRRSAAGVANAHAVDDASTVTDLPGTVDASAIRGWHAPLSFFWQVSRLTVRQFQATLRAPDLTGLRMVMVRRLYVRVSRRVDGN
jgi:hypothetical protein